jgi:hypothetical protein
MGIKQDGEWVTICRLLGEGQRERELYEGGVVTLLI